VGGLSVARKNQKETGAHYSFEDSLQVSWNSSIGDWLDLYIQSDGLFQSKFKVA
jgi:hypothetical protein